MSNIKYSSMLLLSLLLCACSAPARKEPQAAGPAAPAYVVKNSTAPALSAEDMKKVESLYYRAVGAYSNNDMGATLNYIDQISTLYPLYPPAVELLGKIKSVSGNKAAAMPEKR
jgi:hypothetical protein